MKVRYISGASVTLDSTGMLCNVTTAATRYWLNRFGGRFREVRYISGASVTLDPTGMLCNVTTVATHC